MRPELAPELATDKLVRRAHALPFPDQISMLAAEIALMESAIGVHLMDAGRR